MNNQQPHILVAMDAKLIEAFFHPSDFARLDQLGVVRICPTPKDLTTEAAREALADAEILITGWGSGALTAEVLDGSPKLRALVHTGGSVRAIVSDAVYERGIAVSSQTALNAEPVAEFCLATIILATKGVLPAAREYERTRARVDALESFAGVGFFGSVIGIVGLSQISRRLIEMLRPFRVEVLVYSSYLEDEEAALLGVENVELADLMRRSDVVSVHSAATPSNHHLVSREMIALIRDGATLINTARGVVVDQEALTEALASGRFEAILDVTEPEVTVPDSPLWDMDNVLLTPHWAGSLGRELFRLGQGAVDNVEEYLGGVPLTGAVTAALSSKIA